MKDNFLLDILMEQNHSDLLVIDKKNRVKICTLSPPKEGWNIWLIEHYLNILSNDEVYCYLGNYRV